MDHFRTNEFTIVVDSNETAPFGFQDLTVPGTRKGEPERIPLIVPTERQPLWNLDRREVEIRGEKWLVGYADYTIKGMEKNIAIERKSVADLFGTLSARRDKFEAEICRLSQDCRFAAVVVEGGWDSIAMYRETGLSPASVTGTIIAWKQRYPNVQWELAPGRAMAERITFRHLERFWNVSNSKGES